MDGKFDLRFKDPRNLHRNLGKHRVLYFLRSAGLLKIGIAADLAKRMRDYRQHNPAFELEHHRKIPAALAIQVERAVHDAFRDRCVYSEWFDVPTPEAVAVAKPIVADAYATLRRWRGSPLLGSETLEERFARGYFLEKTEKMRV